MVAGASTISIRRTAAIGDVVAATVIADKLADIGYDVNFQTSPAIAPILKWHPNISWITDTSTPVDIDLDGCYECDPLRTKRHFSEMFLDRANKQLKEYGVDLGANLNCVATLKVPDRDKISFLEKLSQHPKPWVFICPRSKAWANRTVPDYIWEEAAKLIRGTKFWLYPENPPHGIIDLKSRNIGDLPVWLSCADLLVSVDTGPLHIAAAVGCPIVALEQASAPELHISDRRDFVVIRPLGLDCLNCQKNLCPKAEYQPPCQNFKPELIAEAVNKRLRSLDSDDVSAVISVYKPKVDVLNRCLKAVEPQVSEIVICSDQAGRVPDGVWTHPKIRYVKSPQSDIGYGRKQNFCARHANGRYLLLLNDDLFLDSDAVTKMVDEMVPGVGIVSNLLRYPDGTIYHAGKVRAPRVRGWAHIDHRKYIPTFKKPTELENCCGACVMVSRKCFYDIAGFDEDFYIYAEDDDFALRARRAGWRIMFTPFSTGVHMEAQSTSITPNMTQHLNHSNAIFGKKWGWYFDLNTTTIPGRFE